MALVALGATGLATADWVMLIAITAAATIGRITQHRTPVDAAKIVQLERYRS